MEHTCPAAVITCVDFRFWHKLVDYLDMQGVKKYDLIGMAGGAKNLLAEDTRKMVFRQLDICTNKHCIEKVYMMNHFDCGVYGGSVAFESKEAEREKLIADLESAKQIIQEKYPSLGVELLLMDFDEVEVIAKAGVAS